MEQQYLQRAAPFENLKAVGPALGDQETDPHSVGFECNICLDLVQDPVVTFCGHLYCWPCIYRWINFQETSPENQSDPQCPVCKADVSEKMLIPLYGRGQATTPSKDKLSHLIPQRPSSPGRGNNVFLPNASSNNRSYPFRTGSYMASPGLGRGGGSGTHLADPMIGMFGEMVYSRIFGNSETTLYTYPNSYHLAGSNTPRLRRRMMQTDKSLSRLCFFFFCCMILCLLLF